MDRKLLVGAIALFILELFVFAIDLGWLQMPGVFLPYSPQSETQNIIGTVIETDSLVQRKSKNSVVWESTQKSDALSAYDSVLTLENSSASLRLENDIQLNLSGNTLVVIEPSTGANKNALKIKFQRGHLRSRSTQKDVTVQSQEWTIEAESGAEISVLETNSDQLEVEVHEGQAQLKSSDGRVQEKIKAGVRITAEDQKLSVTQVKGDVLEWRHPQLSTAQYGYSFPIEFTLSWTGSATALEIIRPGDSAVALTIDPSAHTQVVQLNMGDTLFRLRSGEISSETLRIQAKPAEKILYLSPLPRDRVEAEQPAQFIWMPTRQAKSFELQVSRDFNFSEILESYRSPTPQLQLQLKNTGVLYWRVEALDEEGVVIPSYYIYPLYHVPDLLAPPQLRPVLPRAPAATDDKSSWLDFKKIFQHVSSLFVPQAAAETSTPQELKKAVIFSWYEVPGADHYVIEISEDATFVKPIVTQKVKGLEFSWSGFAFKTYYYRVAAGQESGRMGQFSQPEKADFSQLQNESFSKELQPGLRLAIEKPRPSTPQSKEKSESPKPENSKSDAPTKAEAPPVMAQQKVQFHLFWSGGYVLNFHSSEQSVKANQGGWTAERLGLEATTPLKNHGYLGASIEFLEVPWVPSETEYPFQKELIQRAFFAQVFYGAKNDRSPWGLFYQTLDLAKRSGNESLTLETVEFYGLTTQTEYEFLQTWGTKHRLGLGYGGNRGLFRTENFVYRTLDLWAPQTGRTGFEFNLLYGQGESSVNFIHSQIMYRLEFCF